MGSKDGPVTVSTVSKLAARLPSKTKAELAAIYGAGVRDRDYYEWVDSELRRPAREALGPWLAELARWQLFPTLTYDLRRVEVEAVAAKPKHRFGSRRARPGGGRASFEYRVSAEKVARDLRRFVRSIEAALGRGVLAVFALEQHKSGHLHVHGLIGFAEGQEILGSLLSELVITTQTWYRAHGYAKVRRIETQKDAVAIAEYCAKYMTKDYSDLVFCGGLERGGKPNQDSGRI